MSNSEKLSKASYCIGLSIALNIKSSGVNEIDMESFVEGMATVFEGGDPKYTPEEANKVIEEFLAEIENTKGAVHKEEGAKFLVENAKKDGVISLPSGLQYKILTEGVGAKPKATNSVKCHYEGRLIDGTVFDSSYRRGEPATFPVNGVIAGWVEALQMMPVGSKWQLYIPSELAYGSHGAGQSIPPYATLVFDVELIDIL